MYFKTYSWLEVATVGCS